MIRVRAWLAAMAVLAATPAGAQDSAEPSTAPAQLPRSSADSFRLDPAPQRQPRAQGPADPDQPIVVAPAPARQAPTQQAPASNPATTVTAPSPSRTVPQPRVAAPVREAREEQRTRASEGAEPQQSTTDAPPQPVDSAPIAAPAPQTAPATTAPATRAVAPNQGSGWLWWLALIPAALLGYAVWRMLGRRREEAEEMVAPRPAAVKTEPAKAPVPAPAPLPAIPAGTITSRIAAPPPPPPKLPATARAGGKIPRLSLRFEPQGASQSVRFAAVQYRAVLRNEGKAVAHDVRLASALLEGGRTVEAAIDAFARSPVDHLPALARIEPGQDIVLNDELRLALDEIRPIAHGNRLLLVPVAAFAVHFSWEDGDHFVSGRTLSSFVVGIESEPPSAKMAPFRIDLGPRRLGPVGQRPGRVPIAA